MRATGILEYAAANNMIVLFPQVDDYKAISLVEREEYGQDSDEQNQPHDSLFT